HSCQPRQTHLLPPPTTTLCTHDVANTHPLQPPADNSLQAPAQPDDNGSSAVTNGDSFKFADNDSAHPGTIPNDPPALTGPSSGPSGAHGPAAPTLATTFDVPATVMRAAPDKLMFAENAGHGPGADHKTDKTEDKHPRPGENSP